MQLLRKGLIYLLLLALVPAELKANSFGINLYGLSHHFREKYQSRVRLNEFNHGFGARASFGSRQSGTFLIEGGSFEDTFEHQAKYLGVGYKFRVLGQLRLGVIGAVYTTKSLNNGGTLAAIPVVSYTVWRFTLNGVYLPKYESVNPYHILGTYLTIHLFEGQPSKRTRQEVE